MTSLTGGLKRRRLDVNAGDRRLDRSQGCQTEPDKVRSDSGRVLRNSASRTRASAVGWRGRWWNGTAGACKGIPPVGRGHHLLHEGRGRWDQRSDASAVSWMRRLVVGQEHHQSNEDTGGWPGTPVVGNRDQVLQGRLTIVTEFCWDAGMEPGQRIRAPSQCQQ
jgi:hypothetical protein